MGSSRYCYWSVATAAYAERMQACVDSARACGVFKDFHVLTSRPLRGCECYDLMDFQRQGGLFPVFYLELAMRKLNYGYFVLVDADTRFDHAPLGVVRDGALFADSCAVVAAAVRGERGGSLPAVAGERSVGDVV